jgi:hypothetical protein
VSAVALLEKAADAVESERNLPLREKNEDSLARSNLTSWLVHFTTLYD